MRRYRGQILTGLVLLLIHVTAASAAELDVTELIAGVKTAVVEAQKTAKPPYWSLPWVEGEIKYVVKKEGGGGLKTIVVTVEGQYSTEAVHSIKFRIEPPPGTRVEQGEGIKKGTIVGFDPKAMKVFIAGQPYGLASNVDVINVEPQTRIVDLKGQPKDLSHLLAGTEGTIIYRRLTSTGQEKTAAQTATADPQTRLSYPTASEILLGGKTTRQ